MIISPDRYGGSRIARHRDGGIWVWGEEYGFIGYQALGRKPQMEQPGQVLRIEYTYFPDSGSRSRKRMKINCFPDPDSISW